MNIIINNTSGSEVDVSEDDKGNVTVNITSNELNSEVKKGFEQLLNPNSYSSKMLNRAVRAPRRG